MNVVHPVAMRIVERAVVWTLTHADKATDALVVVAFNVVFGVPVVPVARFRTAQTKRHAGIGFFVVFHVPSADSG
jgi:hypothetical protein